MKRILPVLLFAVLGAAACSDSTGSGPRLTKLVVEPSTYYLGVGDTVHLSAVGTRSDDEEITASPSYSSSNSSVATVNGNGKVTAVSIGTATITAKAGGQTATVNINVLAAGAFRTFNVESTSEDGCSAPQYHLGRLVATTAHVMLYEDTQNPTGGFSNAEYQALADEFEAVGYQTDVANFGAPSDLDGNGKVIGLFTRAVNELTPAGANFVYGGFFYSRDLFPRTPKPGFGACPTSNVSEMFYLLAPDSGGTINGHKRSKAYVRENTLSTLPHELQHLINSSRRFFVNNVSVDETVWLDEGLSHVAEELAYYAKSGYAPGQNLNSTQVLGTQAQFNNYAEYQDNNLGRLSTYLQDPQNNSPIANNDELETRGATWWLLRYLADRKGGNQASLWFALANPTTSGVANLQAALGVDPLTWARDWAVMNYTDDAVATAAQYQEASWNHRSIFKSTSSGTYPLRVMTLPNGNSTISVMAASAAYYKFGVAPATSADVRFVQAGGAAPGACTTTTLTVGQVQQVTMNTGVGFCLAGGATGAEYVAIPFYGSSTAGNTISITVTATGVIPPVGPPTPVRAATAGSPLFPLDNFDVNELRGGGRELQLRLRERRLSARLRAGVAPAFRSDIASVEGPTGVTINIVRTK